MTQYLLFLLLGLGNGAAFASLALALVVTYRSSGVINFATGAVALYTAYTYAFLRQGKLVLLVPGLPSTVGLGGPLGFFPAAAVALVVAAVGGLLLYLLVFRPLRTAPPVARAVASLGVMVLLQAVMAQRLGTTPVSADAIFPSGSYSVGGVRVPADRVWFAVTIVMVALAVAGLFRYTRFGLATRAAAETEKGAVVSGISPDRIAALNWMVSGAVAGLGGILIAPIVPLVPVSYTLFIVPALAAALIGRFTSLLPAVLAGVAIGMLSSEATYLQSRFSWLPSSGLAELVPLILIVAVLVVRGQPLPSRGTLIRQTLGRAPRPRGLVRPTGLSVAVGVAGLLALHGTWRAALLTSIIMAIVCLSLVVVTGYVGQVSLAQLTLAGAAGFLLSNLTDGWGVPFPLAPLLAAVAAAVIGVVVGLPALRIRGLSVGVVTLALAVGLEALWFKNNDLNGSGQGAKVAGPSLFGLNLRVGTGSAYPRLGFCLLCLATLVVVAFGVARLRTSRLGSAMLAVRANERAAAAAGVDVARTKLAGFAIGAFIAGIGGSLLAYKQTTVTYDSFDAITGLGLFATVYLAGITSVSGGVLAGLLAAGGLSYAVLDHLLTVGFWYEAITGLLLIITVLTNPEGIVGPFHTLADRLRIARTSTRASTPEAADTAAAGTFPANPEGPTRPLHTLVDRVDSRARVSRPTGGAVTEDPAAADTPAGEAAGTPATAGDNAPATAAAAPVTAAAAAEEQAADAIATAPASVGAVVATPRAPADEAIPAGRAAANGSGPPAPPAVPLLQLHGVGVRYGGVVAVSDVTLDATEGAIVGLIGPNGAGKTTLIDAISGFTGHTGSVLLDGRPLDGRKPHERVRAGLGRTFQAIELYDDLTVGENITVGLAATAPRTLRALANRASWSRAAGRSTGRRPDTAVDAVFALLGLDDMRERPAGELSQGQRQLVSIGRALVSSPRLLLLDEPAAGLDTTESAWLAGRLRAVRGSGVTVVLVDHDMDLVLNLCDSVHVLNFGTVIASGHPTEIRADQAVTEAYLGATHARQEVEA
ncbi:branched-chain amino acid ABC transporter permease/ATP-binding protein [Frankia sp. Cas3]|uniref:branched-chain amino acid ABC transporter permease/ATP-binding protein n=1 Tax=Frankia sp. Cas3 TaxID=3073926 RepID=UPI002AD2C221|nr:branched-chain amino acid ABC transporter permease/ATP-binding protein [Frankia sp. Cas3]